jgi:hypothetical protein
MQIPSWHHLIIYLMFFFVGGYVIARMPQLNVVGKAASAIGV